MKTVFVNFVAVLVVGILVFPSCSQKKNMLEPKRTVIAGVVNNFSDNASVLVVNYCDPLSDERLFAQNLIESNGSFHTEHEYVFAQNITIRFANRSINCFVHPGDSIFINIDANEMERNFNNAVTFSGDNSELNKELFLWTRYWYGVSNQNRSKFDFNASPEEFLASVKRNFDEAQDSIAAYSKRTNMSDFLKNWAYIDHKYLMANLLMDYNNKDANRWEVFTNPIFNVFSEDNFQTMMFQYHLPVCMGALLRSEPEIRRLQLEEAYIPVIRLSIEKLLEKAPKGVVRDVMLLEYLKSMFNGISEMIDVMPSLNDVMSELIVAIPDFKTAFSQELFYKKLEGIADKNKKVETQQLSETEKTKLTGIVFLDDDKTENLPDVKLLQFLSEKYKDKVLYIDVWATWCGPCIEEFEFTPNLHEYFKDKDVVFINLCLSSPSESWKPSIVKYNVDGENYFLDDYASQLFMSEHNLPGFPSYLIIDKDGGIHYTVPRPSELESAIQKIESCLK